MPLTHGQTELDPGPTYMLTMRFRVGEAKKIDNDKLVTELCQALGLPIEVRHFVLAEWK